MKKTKVFFTGMEGNGWALDEYQRLAVIATRDFVEPSSLEEAEVVHSAWWEGLLGIPIQKLDGKKIIVDFDNPPAHWVCQPTFRYSIPLVSMWITHGTQATEQAKLLGIPHFEVPYRFDHKIFGSAGSPEKGSLRKKWGIPEGAYVVGNFHRDSSAGDLTRPKIQKGADIFVEVVSRAHKVNSRLHVLLAGPRRHFLRAALKARGVPFTFIGTPTESDDFKTNILPRETLRELYQCLDLCLVTSRWEGGPYSIPEAVALKCKILSTRVGIAQDVLEPANLFSDIQIAVERIVSDMNSGSLTETLDKNHCNLIRKFGPEEINKQFKCLYEKLKDVNSFSYSDKYTLFVGSEWDRNWTKRIKKRALSVARRVGLGDFRTELPVDSRTIQSAKELTDSVDKGVYFNSSDDVDLLLSNSPQMKENILRLRPLLVTKDFRTAVHLAKKGLFFNCYAKEIGADFLPLGGELR